MKYNCKVPCTKEKLKVIRSFVNKSLDHHGLSDVDISALVLAIDEVCANLIIHSHHCNPEEYIEVVIKIYKNKGIEFNILDEGESFDIRSYQEPTLNNIIESKRKGGLGLILVKKIMDEIEFIKQNRQNCCKLYKKVKIK